MVGCTVYLHIITHAPHLSLARAVFFIASKPHLAGTEPSLLFAPLLEPVTNNNVARKFAVNLNYFYKISYIFYCPHFHRSLLSPFQLDNSPQSLLSQIDTLYCYNHGRQPPNCVVARCIQRFSSRRLNGTSLLIPPAIY